MLHALSDAGVRPDLVIGTSVGAINGAWVAGGGEAGELIDIWLGLKRADMFPFRPLQGLQAFMGRRQHGIFPSVGLGGRRLIDGGIVNNTHSEELITRARIGTNGGSSTVGHTPSR